MPIRRDGDEAARYAVMSTNECDYDDTIVSGPADNLQTGPHEKGCVNASSEAMPSPRQQSKQALGVQPSTNCTHQNGPWEAFHQTRLDPAIVFAAYESLARAVALHEKEPRYHALQHGSASNTCRTQETGVENDRCRPRSSQHLVPRSSYHLV